jgi:phosphoserine phosphatase
LSRLVAFDVDSTLLRVESLDTAIETSIADHPEAASILARLSDITSAGMTGSMALRESLESRLQLANLNRTTIDAVAQTLRKRITPGMKPLLASLRAAGDDVHAISGGFIDLLRPVLVDLGFNDDRIHANSLVFESDLVSGLDATHPLSRNGGKSEILGRIAGEFSTIVMVGDGMTDFETFEQGIADRFIGFGVISAREVVIAACEWAGTDYVKTVSALDTALRR